MSDLLVSLAVLLATLCRSGSQRVATVAAGCNAANLEVGRTFLSVNKLMIPRPLVRGSSFNQEILYNLILNPNEIVSLQGSVSHE